MKKNFLRMSLLAGMLAAVPALLPAATSNEELAKRVRRELVTLPFYSLFDNLSFRIEGGTVTLLGQVNRPTMKTDAERVVKRISGVAAVDNQIEVLPLSPFDDRLRIGVVRAVYSQPALQRYALGAVPGIHVIVKNGNVTLEGVVTHESEKNIAFIQANGVSGVFSVTNNLRVERQADRKRG